MYRKQAFATFDAIELGPKCLSELRKHFIHRKQE